jgi:5-methylcytosine-specific restriction endonuclease McrA
VTPEQAIRLKEKSQKKSGLIGRAWYRLVYLKSEHWKLLREAKFKQVGRKCEKCPSIKILQVHHIRYKEIFNVILSDLQVLCRKCHKKIHKKK